MWRCSKSGCGFWTFVCLCIYVTFFLILHTTHFLIMIPQTVLKSGLWSGRLWKLWLAILVNFTPILWTHIGYYPMGNARISELQPDCKIFVSYDFPKNWLHIIHQPLTLFHTLRPKSANQTFLSPSGLKQRQSWLVSYYKCYYIYLQYIHCSDMCCIYIFKWPWLQHQPIIVFISPMAK